MRPRTFATGLTIFVAAGMIITRAQTAPTTVDGLVSAAKVAAGTDWSGTFLRLCIPPPATGRGTAPAVNSGRAANAAPAAAAAGRAGRAATAPPPPARDTWYAEPAKVADHFYF